LSTPKKAFQGNFSYHLVVWALLIIPNVFGSTFLLRAGFETYISTLLIRNGLLLAVIYINYLVLIPIFFKTKRYVPFAFLSVIAVTVLVTINTLLEQHNYEVLNIEALKPRELLQEILFYVFNICSYILTSFLLFSLQEKQQIELEKLGTEIKYLRAQINPHFLFNTLNNLYGLALEKSEKTPEIIMKLSKIMDYMLYESNDLKVYLKKDIDNIGNYIDIERIRQGNNAEISFEVKGDIDDQVIVPLTLLPLVENAFKHGINTIIKDAYMRVVISVRGNDLGIDVKNNFKKPESSERNGIGLLNLEHRLNLFYKGKYTMTNNISGNEYHVNLKLKL
jgi:two-component system LytT family sensor kinase